MAIALKNGTDGRLQQIQVGDSLQADLFERLAGSGNLLVGSLLGAVELRLGSASALIRAMGDLQVDGQLDADLDCGANDLTNVKSITYGDPSGQTSSGSTLTINLSTGKQKHRIVLASNITTVTLVDPPGAGNFTLEFVQNGTGSFTVTGWSANVFWLGGTAPTFGDGANTRRLVSLYYNGTTEDDYYGEFNAATYS